MTDQIPAQRDERPRTRDQRPDLPRLTWNTREVAAQLGVSYEAVLRLINSGQLAHIKIGVKKLVPDEALKRYVSNALADSA